jgi:hypothetical protein
VKGSAYSFAALANRLARGLCASCGHEVQVLRNGNAKQHNTRRVRRGADGNAETYMTGEKCKGSELPAEPIGAWRDATPDETPGELTPDDDPPTPLTAVFQAAPTVSPGGAR